MPPPHRAVALAVTLLAMPAAAQTSPDATAPAPAPQPAPAVAPAAAPSSAGVIHAGTNATVTLAGYVEALYSFNFNLPSNGVTAYRGFDSVANSFSISNAVLDASWLLGPVSGRVAFQIGTTGAIVYAGEPTRPSGWGNGGLGPSLWQYLQQANVGWRPPIRGEALLIEAGLFLSPIGPEGMAVKDNWNWSRSNLFTGLPYYHAGLRGTYAFSERWTAALAIYNGWNNVTDNNDEKSFSLSFTYTPPEHLSLTVLYFGGIERPPGAPEGRAWRNLFDLSLTWAATPIFSLIGEVDAGFEPNNLGITSWAAGALSAHLKVAPWLYLAARGDFFYEYEPTGATPLFWVVNDNHGWISSGTFTLDARPHDNVSIRLEYRHDLSEWPMFFGQTATSVSGVLQPTVAHQDTLMAGIVTWF